MLFCGRSVKKKLIPKNLIKKYKLDNLWIYNLRKDWRLLYSIGRDKNRSCCSYTRLDEPQRL